MSLLIKNWSLADWKELLKWAKIGLNNAMIGEFSEVEEIPPHGRLIDADALIRELEITEEDDHNGATLLMAVFLEVLKSAPTVIDAEEE